MVADPAFLALVGATIHPAPDEEAVHEGVVLVDGAAIAAVGTRAGVQVPDGARVLDCSGGAITAGFWNSHVHFFERKWADAATLPAGTRRIGRVARGFEADLVVLEQDPSTDPGALAAVRYTIRRGQIAQGAVSGRRAGPAR